MFFKTNKGVFDFLNVTRMRLFQTVISMYTCFVLLKKAGVF